MIASYNRKVHLEYQIWSFFKTTQFCWCVKLRTFLHSESCTETSRVTVGRAERNWGEVVEGVWKTRKRDSGGPRVEGDEYMIFCSLFLLRVRMYAFLISFLFFWCHRKNLVPWQLTNTLRSIRNSERSLMMRCEMITGVNSIDSM